MEVEGLKKVNITDMVSKFFTEQRTDRILELLRGKKGAARYTDRIGVLTNMDAACEYSCQTYV